GESRRGRRPHRLEIRRALGQGKTPMKSWNWMPAVALAMLTCAPALAAAKEKTRFLEKLDRGLVAVHQADGRVFLSWRLLASDADGTAFNVYRETAAPADGPVDPGRFAARPDAPAAAVKLNAEPLSAGTWFIDGNARLDRQTNYSVAAVVG